MTVPTFGTLPTDSETRPRRAAYGVILDGDRGVLVVRGPSACFLPGGGAEGQETTEETIHREAQEELGCDVLLLERIGEAVQYFQAEGVSWRMEAVFFRAELASPVSGVHEWLAIELADTEMYHACHAWAIGKSVEC
jgi:8-oxo-dGTP pyrophosphatase MutT (NUDIX family)